jgi:hypothetical protein
VIAEPAASGGSQGRLAAPLLLQQQLFAADVVCAAFHLFDHLTV